MKKVSILALSLVLLAFTATALSSVQADTGVNIYISDPYNTANGAYGLSSGGMWVGQIPITITSGSTQAQTQSYCINFDRTINIGGTYQATITPAADTAEWRAVSYVLSWNNPTNNNQGAAAQVAVWRLLNQTRGTNYYIESWMTPSIDSAGNTLATTAYGRDVVRQGDIFRWIAPITRNMSDVEANAGETVAFTAKLSAADGNPRPNVLVNFSVILNSNGQQTPLNQTYVVPTKAYTDSQGLVQVRVKVPTDTPLGATISVEASTKSVWPQRYIDVSNPSSQDLIGMGNTFELTISTNMCILGYIHVVPESPLGALAAIGAVGLGFGVWAKVKRHKKHP